MPVAAAATTAAAAAVAFMAADEADDDVDGSLRASMGHSPVAVTVVQRHGDAYELLCWLLLLLPAVPMLPALVLPALLLLAVPVVAVAVDFGPLCAEEGKKRNINIADD